MGSCCIGGIARTIHVGRLFRQRKTGLLEEIHSSDAFGMIHAAVLLARMLPRLSPVSLWAWQVWP